MFGKGAPFTMYYLMVVGVQLCCLKLATILFRSRFRWKKGVLLDIGGVAEGPKVCGSSFESVFPAMLMACGDNTSSDLHSLPLRR